MIGKYAFSLNGESYRGAFASREEAVAAALEAAHRSPDSPPTVFVGRLVPADPKACGHARSVISHMVARAREQFGDSAAGYLTNLSKPQIENLDQALELTVLGWLTRNELLPTFHKVDAIGEYPVPVSPSIRSSSEQHEVQEIGDGGFEM